jgi:hypothetical protein
MSLKSEYNTQFEEKDKLFPILKLNKMEIEITPEELDSFIPNLCGFRQSIRRLSY